MQKLKENPLLERPHLEPMFNYAKEKHDKTKAVRKYSGNPYWEHPSGVADLALAYGGSDIEVEVALAHDTLEDTDATYEEIVNEFGETVAGYVQEITNDKDKIYELGKEEYINQELVNLSHPALFVKLCDILYNMLDHPKKEQAERMCRNIDYLMTHRRKDLNSKEWDLIESIPMFDE